MQGVFASTLAMLVRNKAPLLAAKPLSIMPFTIKQQLIKQLSNAMLKDVIDGNGLDFLNGKWVAISITDLAFTFEISFEQQILVRPVQNPDVTFGASSEDLLLIAAGKEDPDSLFFRRQLSIEGNTELGLRVKNLLTALDSEKLSPLLQYGLEYASQALLWLQQQQTSNPQPFQRSFVR